MVEESALTTVLDDYDGLICERNKLEDEVKTLKAEKSGLNRKIKKLAVENAYLKKSVNALYNKKRATFIVGYTTRCSNCLSTVNKNFVYCPWCGSRFIENKTIFNS